MHLVGSWPAAHCCARSQVWNGFSRSDESCMLRGDAIPDILMYRVLSEVLLRVIHTHFLTPSLASPPPISLPLYFPLFLSPSPCSSVSLISCPCAQIRAHSLVDCQGFPWPLKRMCTRSMAISSTRVNYGKDVAEKCVDGSMQSCFVESSGTDAFVEAFRRSRGRGVEGLGR